MKIVQFNHDHIEEAAALVALRYQAERDHNPLFPAQFEQAEAIMPQLQKSVGNVPGVAAIRDNRLAGFLLGFKAPLFRRIRGAFSPDWGHATDGNSIYDTYRAMYAELSKAWLANGCFAHAIQLYAHECEAQKACLSLGFGMRGIDALRDLNPIQNSATEIEIRQVGREDIATLIPLQLELERHLAAAPIFLPLTSTPEEAQKSLEEWLSETKHALWLAYHTGEAVGYMRVEPSCKYNLAVSNDVTASITGAFIKKALRGSGVGTALLNQVLSWARENGYQNCSVDCESANIDGARFWLKHFQPVCYALVRCIDERMAWANERREANDVW
jgi:GNAT superfamily N-acetyltransferase